MNGPASFARVRELFERALDVEPVARAAFLDAQCGADRALRRQVEQLLHADTDASTAGAVLDASAAELVGVAPQADGTALPGERIGGFRIEGVLGGGGMGTVYRARQDVPARDVALKVLSLGLLGDVAVRRFRWEAEVLARLRHPGIAQVYAVGVHQSGALELPWFAMELVDGALDLTAYATGRGLDLRARVELLLQVCDAVHHGHLLGVVHRDLKPQNVLVDRDGRVKVIDFGIARSADGDTPVHTERGHVVGTVAYMSPEHLAGDDVDLRTDVWSLGVIAFELVAGERPFAATSRSALAAARAIQDGDAPSLRRLVPAVGVDLDLVVGKALRADRAARYPSVAAFADDLRAWLAARPVSARAPTTLYQLRLFARRRRGLVAALAAIAVIVVVSLVALTLQNLELGRRGRLLGEQNLELGRREERLTHQNAELGRREEMLARQNVELGRRERLAARVAKFARDFLAESDAMKARGVDYTVREALDVAARGFDAEAFPDAATEAELRVLVGETYRDLSLPDVAEPHLRRAIARAREAAGANDASTVRAEIALALTLREQDRIAEATELLDDAVARGAVTATAEDPLALSLRNTRALLWRDAGRLGDAEREYRAVAAARERVLGPDDDATLSTLQSLGTLLLALQRPDEARDVLATCLQRAERAGATKTSTWQIADNLAEAWRMLGEYDRAAAAHRQAIAGYTALLGPDHALTLGCGYHLLKLHRERGDYPALRDLAADMVPRCERTFGPEHRRTMHVLAAHAIGLMNCGDAPAACRLLERAYAVQARDLGVAHVDTFVAGHNLVSGRLANGDGGGALAVAAELAARLADAKELPPVAAATTHVVHARALLAAGRAADARTAVDAARALAPAELRPEHPLRKAIEELAGQVAAAPR
jgi:serine/threonine protein kinase